MLAFYNLKINLALAKIDGFVSYEYYNLTKFTASA
jgi:hypothetical protein